jgi:hypothetical protein
LSLDHASSSSCALAIGEAAGLFPAIAKVRWRGPVGASAAASRHAAMRRVGAPRGGPTGRSWAGFVAEGREPANEWIGVGLCATVGVARMAGRWDSPSCVLGRRRRPRHEGEVRLSDRRGSVLSREHRRHFSRCWVGLRDEQALGGKRGQATIEELRWGACGPTWPAREAVRASGMADRRQARAQGCARSCRCCD